jgi:hypothetical protein
MIYVLPLCQTEESCVDLIRKDRYETEYKLQDIHVKNVTVDFFAFPMTIAGLALVFKFTADMESDGVRLIFKNRLYLMCNILVHYTL